MKVTGLSNLEVLSGLRAVISTSKRRYRVLALVSLVGLIGVVILQGWKNTPAGAGDVVDEAENDPNVVEVPIEAQENVGLRVVQPSRKKLQSAVTATGIVSPDQTRYAHITPLGRGIVEKVYVTLGDRVRPGQALVSYDNIELGDLIGEYLNLLGGVEKLEAERQVARKILDRAKALLEVEAIAEQQYEVRQAEYEQAAASVQSQKADLARVEEKLHRFGLTDKDIAELKSSPHESPHRTASHNVLRAPFGGIIIKYDISPGELVDREQRLFTLVDTSTVWVLADVYEKDIGLVRAGEGCRVEVPSYPGEVFHGQVTYVSDFLDPASRTAKVRCVVLNGDSRLKLEMFATVSIQVHHEREGLTIPIRALQQMNGETVVFVQEGANRFERRVVTIGERSQDWAEVLSGLRGDESIVTSGGFYLKSIFLREQIGGEH